MAPVAPEPRSNAEVSARRSVLVLMTEAFGRRGGIQTFNRLLLRTLGELASEEALVLADAPRDVDERYGAGTESLRAYSGSRLRFAAAAIRAAARRRPDVILLAHLNFARLAPWLRAASPRSRVWFVAYGIEAWKRLSPSSRRVLRRADRIVAISRYTAETLCRENDLPRERVAILPCGYDPLWTAVPAAGRAPARPTLLTVARLDAADVEKGVDRVIRALPAIARKVPDVRYVVVGEGNDRGRLEALAAETGVADRVNFRGALSDAQVVDAYRQASLFVMPSRKEGFGIVFLEAALCGVPSIAARAGGAPEVVLDGETGRLIEGGGSEELAAAVIDVLSDPERLGKLGAAARSRALAEGSPAAFRARFARLWEASS